MTTRTVRTKKELKDAINAGVDTIIIEGALVKDVKPLVKVMELPLKKRNALIGFLSAGGAAVVASVAAAPATMGISGIAGTAAVASFAAGASISIPLIVTVITLCVVIGIPPVISLIRAYDIKADETGFMLEVDSNGSPHIEVHRRIEY